MDPIFPPIVCLLILKDTYLRKFLLIFLNIKFLHLLFNLDPIYVYLILQTIKFIIPASGYIFLLDHALERILSQFLISTSVLVAI